MWHRTKPVAALVLLAPLIAEYLLGSLSFAQLGLFPIMAMIYGAGALFVREAARRSGRGWPTILTLGLAYAVVEEGLATQSLFNPNYLGLRLLDYGFIPALGTSAPWTVYVIVLHVAWSIAVPISFVEALFPDRRQTPWLGRPGLAGSGIVYGLGVAMVTFGTWKKEQFVASATQLAVSAGVAVVSVGVAFMAFRPRKEGRPNASGSPGWRPRILGLVAFAIGSVFHLVTQLGSSFLAPAVAAAIALALPAAMLSVVGPAWRSGAWTAAHTDALMLGGLLAYCWLGLFLVARLHGPAAIPGQIFPCAIVLALVYRRFIRGRTGMSTERR